MGLGNGVEDKGEDGDGWVWLIAGWAGKQNGEEDTGVSGFDFLTTPFWVLLLINLVGWVIGLGYL